MKALSSLVFAVDLNTFDMKFLAILLFVALANCQDVERPTVTEDLLAAQRDLTLGHEFAEIYLVQNRELLSDYLERIEIIALDQFMDAYAAIKNLGIDTRAEMDAFEEPSFCKDNIRARWELQVTRYGQMLSQCLGVTYGYLQQFSGILNRLHNESRAYKVTIPNAGINVLSGLDIFDSRDSLRDYINTEFRNLFFRGQNFRAEFFAFISGISIDVDGLIEQYTECYRTLPAAFANESTQDLESIRMCYSD